MKAMVGGSTESVKKYIILDAVIPTVKNLIQDLVSNTVSILLFGEPAGNTRRSSTTGGGPSRASYRSYYDERDRRPAARDDIRDGLSNYSLIFDSEMEARDVLDTLDEIIERYDRGVTVLDLRSTCRLSTTPIDDRYGWTTLRDARIVRSGRDWTIDLPRPRPIR